MIWGRMRLTIWTFLAVVAWLVGGAGPVAAQKPDLLPCQDWRLFQDADFIRHAETMLSLNPCVAYEPLIAGGVEWRLVRLQQGPAIPKSAPLVVVLHDNEDAALVGALSLLAIRNVQIVMLDSAENRHWGGLDPNRLFVSPGAMINNCPFPQHLDARFANAILRDWSGQHPVISLHSNAPGMHGDGADGRGSISILGPKKHQRAFPAAPNPLHPRLTDPDNLIYITGLTEAPSAGQSEVVRRLRAGGVNVLYSQIAPEIQDCSLSDFLTLRGQSDLYFNVEVEEGDNASAVALARRLLFVLETPQARLN